MMTEYVSFWSFISAEFANFVQFASCLQSFVQKLRQHCISWADTIQNILPHDFDSLKEYELFGAIVANVIISKSAVVVLDGGVEKLPRFFSFLNIHNMDIVVGPCVTVMKMFVIGLMCKPLGQLLLSPSKISLTSTLRTR
jgi:hypothetical protein